MLFFEFFDIIQTKVSLLLYYVVWLTFTMSQITNTSIRSNTGYGEIGGINLAEDNFG
jgi:hypothetical protein